jgi:hypothetical protein
LILARRRSEMTNEPRDAQLVELGQHVAEIAYEIFRKCDAEEDFCIQNPAGGVFGGVNRLIFGRDGWRASPSHCTDRFLSKWLEIKEKLDELD